jgi:hypothetical protein
MRGPDRRQWSGLLCSLLLRLNVVFPDVFADANDAPRLSSVPSVSVVKSIGFAQQFHVMVVHDVDVQFTPLFVINATYVVHIDPVLLNQTILPAPLTWARAFRINPVTGVMTAFGRLDVDTYQAVILTVAAVDDKWLPTLFDFFNLTVTIAYS